MSTKLPLLHSRRLLFVELQFVSAKKLCVKGSSPTLVSRSRANDGALVVITGSSFFGPEIQGGVEVSEGNHVAEHK